MDTKQNINYKDTINLPQTNFSMKANLSVKEPEIDKYWKAMDVYGALRTKRQGAKKYILHDGPPYANGHIHIGHAFNKILKDFVVKFNSLAGFDSPYVPGWDCHGLPIEHQVMKDSRQTNRDVLAIRKECREYAQKFIDIQREEFQRLGVFGDWDRPYLTMDFGYEACILECFGRLVERGFVYKKLRPIHWCTMCETALAEAEVEYEQKTSPSVFVKFKCSHHEDFGKPVYLLIWTTTPWTLPANRAVSVHPDMEYVCVDSGNEILVIAETLLESVAAKKGTETVSAWKKGIVKKIRGNKLAGWTYRHIFHDKDLPVILGTHVTMADGTGLVHTAPGHGYEDYIVGTKNGLDVFCPVDARGRFTGLVSDASLLGKYVFDANRDITARLSSQNLLYFEDTVSHAYPHCWRCKKPIIFRATDQWFINVEHRNLRQKALDIIAKSVGWFPAWGETRIRDMVAGRPDWCISRQRNWGVAIPALYCEGCHEAILDSRVIRNAQNKVRASGADVWFAEDVASFLPEGFECPKCRGKKLRKETDILDVWFDSGVSHTAVVKNDPRLAYPADLYLEGSDQHRGWFQSALLTSIGIDDTSPFKNVLTHGFVVDGEGNKMSKSVGNVVKPQEVISAYGADILRLWVASCDYTDDIRISNEIISHNVDVYRKIRNTLKYFLGNLYDFNPMTHRVAPEELLPIDKWAMIRVKRLAQNAFAEYQSHQFYKVYQDVYNFCVRDMSTFYLDILKDRLYTAHKESKRRRSGQTALYRLSEGVAKILAPIMSFTCEEFWGHYPKAKCHENSIHWEKWPVYDDIADDTVFMDEWETIMGFRERVLKEIEALRTAKAIGSSLEASLILDVPEDLHAVLEKHRGDLPGIFIVSQVELRRKDKESIIVERACGEKCQRCWNYSLTIGRNLKHSTLCDRCVAAIEKGE